MALLLKCKGSGSLPDYDADFLCVLETGLYIVVFFIESNRIFVG